MKLRTAIASLAFVSLPLFAACSSAVDEPLEAEDIALVAAPAITGLTAPTILALDVSGDACPAGSVATNIAPNGDAATVSFSKPLVSGTHCALHFRMKGIPGVRVGLPVAHLRGYRPDGARGVFRTRETLSGARVTPTSSYRPAQHEQDYIYTLDNDGERARAYSDCGRKSIDYTLDVSFDDLVARGGVALDSIDFGFTYFEGAVFRGCNNAVLKASASEAGGQCGGPNTMTCVAGLACDGVDGAIGTCFDADAGPPGQDAGPPGEDGGSDQ